jgi:hypothetical protein
MSRTDFTGVNRVRAWDRINGRSVTVRRQDYDPRMLEILVTADAEGMSHWVPAEALDYRYFGEPYDANWAVRRQWARRAAADRRELWMIEHALSTARLFHHWAEHCDRGAAEGFDPERTWFGHVHATEIRNRARGHQHNPPSPAARESIQRQFQRRRASAISREAQRAWDAEDRQRDEQQRLSRHQTA